MSIFKYINPFIFSALPLPTPTADTSKSTTDTPTKPVVSQPSSVTEEPVLEPSTSSDAKTSVPVVTNGIVKESAEDRLDNLIKSLTKNKTAADSVEINNELVSLTNKKKELAEAVELAGIFLTPLKNCI